MLSSVDLVLAAVDTSSVTAAWALHSLAVLPHTQAALRAEISRTGDTVTCDTVRRLPYLGAFIKEVMRLYPVSPFLTRLATQSVSLGPHHIPPGTLILISLYVMGRDQQIFSQPDTFSPERWMRDGETDPTERRRRAFASLPFGHGARSCIGRRIAELELQLLVAKVCQRWRLTSRNENVKYTQRMIGVPDKPISFTLNSVRTEQSTT